MRKLDVDVHIERDGTCDITIWNIPQDPWKEIKRALRRAQKMGLLLNPFFFLEEL